MINEIAELSGVTDSQANRVIEEFLARIHKLEYEGGQRYGLVETIWPMISIRSLYHLLGILESWSTGSNWESGYMREYLLRLGPGQDWDEIRQEIDGWKRFQDEC